MRRSLVSSLCCPKCKGDLELEAAGDADVVETGTLRCHCGATYPVVRSVPRFVADDQYAGNFSFEWTTHRTTQLDSTRSDVSERTFAHKTGLKREDIEGKLVLDIGCGMGRFAEVITKWGGTAIGIDLSLAVDSAQANLGHTGRFQAVQASVFELPFRPGTFDVIYSLGVLHHTPDCKRAFQQLPPLLRSGGTVVIWVYSGHELPPNSVEERRDALYRSFTTRMNKKLLHNIFRVLCLPRVPGRAFWHMILPGFVFHAVPRLHAYPEYSWRVLDAFDWYSPVYQSKHTYPEVYRWFQESGLTNMRLMDFEVAVSGVKP